MEALGVVHNQHRGRRRESEISDVPGPGDLTDRLAGRPVPEQDGAVDALRHEVFPVGRERKLAGASIGVAGQQHADLAEVGRIIHTDRARGREILDADEQGAAVG